MIKILVKIILNLGLIKTINDVIINNNFKKTTICEINDILDKDSLYFFMIECYSLLGKNNIFEYNLE